MPTHFSAKLFFKEILIQLTVYTPQEQRAIVFLVFEKLLGISRSDILTDALVPSLSKEQSEALANVIVQLNNHVPVQYLLKEADFFGNTFYVDSRVLIPRQETEELVACIISEADKEIPVSILDICTGSGCIAISLAKALKNLKVDAVDISEGALEVAHQNAQQNQVIFSLYKQDVLAALATPLLQHQYDIIVSNPPYVTEVEKQQMSQNVLDYEPHLALFVSNESPLIFYSSILQHAQKLLKPQGKIYFEINEQFGGEVAQLMKQFRFENIRILKDLSDKDRIAVAVWKG